MGQRQTSLTTVLMVINSRLLGSRTFDSADERRYLGNRFLASAGAGLISPAIFTSLCESHLDRVSTGSGSDLVSDQHAIFSNDA